MMKRKIDIDHWIRKEHYHFFSKFSEPFFGVTVKVDCSKAYLKAKDKQVSFFLYYLYRALKAANQIENFKYRIINNQVYEFDTVHASPTINRPNGTFGFSYIDFVENESEFRQRAVEEIERVQNSDQLIPAISSENVIHFSTIPWIDFSSISHARSFSHPDSCPKISFGKVTEKNRSKLMPVSVHGHHALMDGFHIGQFLELFQNLINE